MILILLRLVVVRSNPHVFFGIYTTKMIGEFINDFVME